MKIRILFILASLGILIGIVSVYVYNENIKKQPPISISFNPYKNGVYATGTIQSYQATALQVDVFPEVQGRITHIFVHDGQVVKKGDPLFSIDDSVIKETVEKDLAAVQYARANLVTVQQQLQKIQRSYVLDRKSVSLNMLDNAINAVKVNEESVNVAENQYLADKALWYKYVVRATDDGKIFRVVAAVGDYAAPQGTYDSYTLLYLPVLQMGVVVPYMAVRCYLDEILVPSLPDTSKLEAQMFIRGGKNVGIPLEFVYLQPSTVPKTQLSDNQIERVDVRVLPIVFRFKKPEDMRIYPGQLVDIYIKAKE